MNALMGAMPPEPAGRSVVLVDQVTDPHNLGAIIRVVAASRAGGLIVTKDRTSPFSPAAVSASAGTVFGLPIAVVANLAYAMERLKKDGYWLYGLDAADGHDYRKEKYACPSAFIVGSEGAGMRELTRKNADFYPRGRCVKGRGSHRHQGPDKSILASGSICVGRDGIRSSNCRCSKSGICHGTTQKGRLLALRAGRCRRP